MTQLLFIAAVLLVALAVLFLFRVIRFGTAALLALLVVVLAGLASVKVAQIKKMMSTPYHMPPEPVTTAVVAAQTWDPILPAVGTLSAVEGVMVSAQLDGNVAKIAFTAGSKVRAGDLLVQQDVTSEEAQLRAAEAAVDLARINRRRSRDLLASATIAQSQFDSDDATYKQAVAEVENIQTTIDKKTIRAPFSGRLGIRLVDLGQTLKAGDAIVSLQQLDPIYADFYLPQQDLAKIGLGSEVQVTNDVLSGRAVEGRVTAINPDVDTSTRNVRVEATLPNADERLHPGMFVDVTVVLPAPHAVLVIPATSVLSAPYGDSVFVVEDASSGKVVRQQFVRLGERRGDFVEVLSGLNQGDTVVTTGAFKLRNGVPVIIDNALAPDAQLAPTPGDS